MFISRSLTLKLALAFLAVGIMGVVLVTALVGWQTQNAFDRFVVNRYQSDLVEELADYYEANGSWAGIRAIIVRERDRRTGRPELFRIPVTLVNQDRRVVYSAGQHRVGEEIALDRGHSAPIDVNGETVGWLLFSSTDEQRPPLPGSPEAGFLNAVRRATVLSAIGAGVIALLLGGFLAYTITRPVRELTHATQEVARGELGHQVPVRTNDELGQLAESFNQMSADLARSTQLRRQMTADIAHDLRTPLSIILGYTEALADEKLQGTPDIFDVMYGEAQHLQRLIEDLRTLSLADAGELSLNRQQVSPNALLERTAAAYTTRAEEEDVALRVVPADVPYGAPVVSVDPERMAQVLGNLVSNALRYTLAGGEVTLLADVSSSEVRLSVSDTGAGIDSENLPHIFERFYRADESRHDAGESGLGLAIARSIVEAHGGTIDVESEVGEGTTFTVSLPRSEPQQ